MDTIQEVLSTANPKQQLIFCMALYITAPEDLPKADLQDLRDDIERLEQYFVSMDTPVAEIEELKNATMVLINVEGFPFCSEETVADVLSMH